MLHAGKRQRGVTLDQWLLRGPSYRPMLLKTRRKPERQDRWSESRAEPSVREQRVFCLWQARSQAMGLSPRPAEQGGKGVDGRSHGQVPKKQQ